MRLALLLTVLTFLLLACAPARLECTTWDELLTLPNFTASDKWVEQNPCGSLLVRPPLFNVSGQVHGSSDLLGDWVSLHIMPNLTRGAAGYVAGNCASLGRVPINKSGSFVFLSLPVGKYVAVVPSFVNDYSVEIEEHVGSGLEVRQVDAFGDGNHTFSLFFVGRRAPSSS